MNLAPPESNHPSNMSSPAPLLRPPIPGGHRNNNGGPKPPRLGLSIPPSPRVKPVNGPVQQLEPVQPPPQMYPTQHQTPPPSQPSSQPPMPSTMAPPPLQPQPHRPALPRLQLATPMGGAGTPPASVPMQNGRRPSLQPLMVPTGSSSYGEAHSQSRSSSFSGLDVGRASGVGSAVTSSSFPKLTLNMNFRPAQGSSDPVSAAGSVYSDRASGDGGVAMERDDSMNGLPDLEKLSLEKGRPLDVEDLDDNGWRAASMEKRIVELGSLGEGAGGAVTRCMLRGGKTVFALKIITTDPNPDVKKQIVRELNINKSCNSAHVCQYYGAFVDDSTGTISIAMEFCEGGSLDSVYKEVKKLGGRTGEKVLGKVAEGVLNGLTYLHGRKILHRDIKPSNILLCRNGQVKLCDFGVSGEFGTKGDANTFIGTSYYMAPERITGQSYTITSDVWSLGVSLLEVAQHRFPFPADGTEMQPRAGLIDLLTYIVRQPIPKLKDEPDAGIRWSENFKYFIECCLEKEPRRRATPWRMLEHPWMLEMRSKKVNMEHFLKQVWDWKD
ncbi:Pkinase-domain-containing protein [Xylona heveae TC161]|uniref:Pkinase-domain-containing protein n=1 Tax=Xylona heveae (strain CBS 132557 / TC161) TaxID=1328760 RepID=A0A165HZU1_XYLHT|nr:Pkinase-domain-containing protein [Xylona heveae TC161]KZF24151.1 Pkinase-domain-containing protein [Xylona heveae TC161]